MLLQCALLTLPYHFISSLCVMLNSANVLVGKSSCNGLPPVANGKVFAQTTLSGGQKKAMSLCAEVPSVAVLLHLALNGCNGVAHRFTLVCCYCSLCLRLSLIVDYLSQAVAASSNCASLFQRWLPKITWATRSTSRKLTRHTALFGVVTFF